MSRGAARVLVVALVTTAGCATTTTLVETTPVETAVTDFKQVAGAWTSTSGSASRVTLIIQTNGKYWMAVERGAALHGQFLVEGGVLRYGAGTAGSWRGKATLLLDDRRKQYLRFVHDTGVLWMEFEPQ